MSSARAYDEARDQFAQLNVDTERALEALHDIPISLNCWQGDDVAGFEGCGDVTGGGLAVTGNHPGRARNGDELRCDLEFALSQIPGTHRVNLHAMYAETDGKAVDRDELAPEHFLGWIQWAQALGLGLDFNPTYFSHPKASDGFTLAHPDPGTRDFWISHGRACRRIGEAMGASLGSPCISNVWIPDGWKDSPVDRAGPRERLLESLDAVFSSELDPSKIRDSVESKLFGIGSEAYVVGSHEFYLGYAITRGKILCMDTGHFHPTEVVSDKISAVLIHVPEILLHVSRGVRWDSDHVVAFDDELRNLAREVVCAGSMDRIHLALDFFDASINRIAAWVLGTRNLQKALLAGLLTPYDLLEAVEAKRDLTTRLALTEETKTLPLGAVWDEFCERQSTPQRMEWLNEVRTYERSALSNRGGS